MKKDTDASSANEKTSRPLTQKQVEDYIVLKGQSGDRWFRLVFVDADMNDDPVAIALMDSIADIVHAGIISLSLEERMDQAKKDCEGVCQNEID